MGTRPELESQPDFVPDESKEKKTPIILEQKNPEAVGRGDVNTVFEFWQTTLKHPQARLDDKRRKLIRKALQAGYHVNDLKTAILGCSLTPHNMGVNDRGQKYDGLHVILRDADQIDRFIHNALHHGDMDDNRRTFQQKTCAGKERGFTEDDFDLNKPVW